MIFDANLLPVVGTSKFCTELYSHQTDIGMLVSQPNLTNR